MGSQLLTVKKYGNRRLYDTETSEYITLEQLADRIRQGRDVQVLDAKTGRELTQATLAQIILESRRAASLLPVPLLTALVRMGDDALSEFFGRYLSWALSSYWNAKQGLQAVMPYASVLAGPADFMGRVLSGAPPWAVPSESQPQPAAPTGPRDEIAELRRELADLRRSVGRGRRRPG